MLRSERSYTPGPNEANDDYGVYMDVRASTRARTESTAPRATHTHTDAHKRSTVT